MLLPCQFQQQYSFVALMSRGLLEKMVEIKAENQDVTRNLDRRHDRDYNERNYENPQTVIFYQSFLPKSRGIFPESSDSTFHFRTEKTWPDDPSILNGSFHARRSPVQSPDGCHLKPLRGCVCEREWPPCLNRPSWASWCVPGTITECLRTVPAPVPTGDDRQGHYILAP